MRARMIVWCCLVALAAGAAGCGSVAKGSNTDGGGGTPAGGSGGMGGAGGAGAAGGSSSKDAGGGADASTAACSPSKPFGAPTLVSALNSSGNEDGLTFAVDGLTAYLSSTRTGGMGQNDIWFATRASTAQAFGAPTLVEGVNSAGDERGPWISRDGLRLVFFSLPTGASGYHFMVAARQTTIAAFAAPAPVAGLNSSASDATEWFSTDEKTIYFASTRTGGLGDYDIWMADFGQAGASNPRAIQELNSTANDSWPALTADGLTIYYSSGKTGAGAQPGNHIWMASRATTSDGFGSQKVVTELASAASEWPTWISPDGCTVYFGSTRPLTDGGPQTGKFYVATRGQ
jgi:Tol biopolymer transport system component